MVAGRTCREATDDSRACDGGVHDGDHVAELGLEDGGEVCASTQGDEAVTEREGTVVGASAHIAGKCAHEFVSLEKTPTSLLFSNCAP